MYSIGVDLGGTKILSGLLAEDGSLIASVEVSTGAEDGPEAVIDRIYAVISDMLDKAPNHQIAGIGIAAPGPLNYRTGELISPPNLPGWDCIPLRHLVADQFGLPTSLDNDANAAAYAEYLYGAGERAANMVYVTVSTGIGAGVILDGQIRRGESGSAAEVGHMVIQMDGPLCNCGNKGCLEVVASGTAIGRIASQLYNSPMDSKQVAKLASQGDETAQRILAEAFHALGIGLVNVVNLFDPSIIVLGGGVSQIGSPLFEVVRAEVANNRFRSTSATSVHIVPALFGTKAGLIGAAALPFAHQ